MNYKFKSILALLALFAITACETVELELVENPNQVSEESLDPDFLFNNAQLGFIGFFNAAAGGNGTFTQDVTRMRQLSGGNTYNNAYAPVNFNGLWTVYSNALIDIRTLEEPALETGLTYHIGTAKVMESYIVSTLVDLFGDVPYSEALMGETITNPTADPQADLYKVAYDLLDEAIVLLSEEPSLYPSEDLFYGDGDGEVNEDTATLWITAAKTLKLRILNNARLNGSALGVDIVAEANALLSENDLIDTPEENFTFQYGSSRLNPNTRHPMYNGFYENAAGGYMSNWFMWQLAVEKGFDDPRLPYYFYRQDTDATDEDLFTLDCLGAAIPAQYNSVSSLYNSTIVPFCVTDAARGYWGRDHGDNSGIPPDATKRTAPGLYPAGGKFDAGEGGSVQNAGTDGAVGAGIAPIWLSSFTKVIQAEMALTLGTPGDPASLMEDAVRDSFSLVQNFAGFTLDDADAQMDLEDANDDYVTFILDEFSAGSDIRKLDLLMKEYHILAWGNGLETYNNYRRTGFPSNMQPMILPDPGAYFRSALYPNNYVTLNTNANQKERTEQIFWDTNPAGFID
ncbi:SusD/RagB family nutrient-binding outer membrane lipoprotein [Dokdonia sinensis]|uniref:SusD/RagB family nutrient-binding outer membrane lipoprotein n=1 Tax=Dokdonia sinensis TaxID=2479847 RepID=A0A3M0GEA0_9FLAO|nr:SusD/RagB family nutrient-binding outer membrane lipoprotein [Dokdonia sinensis]RMB62807.1 SusD/RagB family nutrient-binding outer membrane lipoprotein [Dokdonia sinensis]